MFIVAFRYELERSGDISDHDAFRFYQEHAEANSMYDRLKDAASGSGVIRTKAGGSIVVVRVQLYECAVEDHEIARDLVRRSQAVLLRDSDDITVECPDLGEWLDAELAKLASSG